MMRTMMLVMALALGGVMGAGAQMGEMKTPAKTPGGTVEPSKALDGLLGLLEGQLMGAAKAMPAEKYNFSPSTLAIKGAKFEGTRTFAEQVKHIAEANYYFAGAVTSVKPTADMKAIEALKGKDEIVAALAESFAALHKANATLTRDNSLEEVQGEGVQTRATVAAFAVAHGFDHYGQMVEYLRMNGVVPPASAK